MDDNSKYLSRRRLAEFLGVSERSIDRWRANGDGPPAYQFGDRTLFNVGEARLWAARHKTAKPTPRNAKRGGR